MAKISLTDEQKTNIIVKGILHTVRFIALANAGGVIATVSIIGATAKEGQIQNYLAWPLGFFLLGLFFSLLESVRLFFLSIEIVGEKPLELDKSLKSINEFLKRFEDAILISPFAFFLLGSVVSVFFIAVAKG